MPDSIQIFNLKHRREFANSVAFWIEEEWKILPIHDYFNAIKTNSKWFLNYPLTLVAVLNNEPIGTVSLLLDDLETRMGKYNPWVGCLFVVKQHRNKGIGKKLLLAIEQQCIKEYGLEEAYLFTQRQQKLYESLNWVKIESDIYEDKEIIIMQKSLSRSLYESNLKQQNLIIDLFDKSPITMWACDKHYKIVLWNSGAESIYGHKKEDVLGKSYLELFIDPIEREQSMKDCDRIIEEGYTQINCLASDKNFKGDKREMLTNVFRIQSPTSGEFFQAEIGVLINDLYDKQKDYKSFREAMLLKAGQESIESKKELLTAFINVNIKIHLTQLYHKNLKEIDVHYKLHGSSQGMTQQQYIKAKDELKLKYDKGICKIEEYLLKVKECKLSSQFEKLRIEIEDNSDELINIEI